MMLVTIYHYKSYGEFNIKIQFMQSSCEVIYLQPFTFPYLDILQNVLSTNQVSTTSPKDTIINISYPAESCLVGYMIPSKLYMTHDFDTYTVIYILSTYYNGRQYANEVQVYFGTDLSGHNIFGEGYMSQEDKNTNIHLGGTFSLYFVHFSLRSDIWPCCLYIFHAH